MSELGPEAQSILEAGRDGDDPTAEDRARVRASLARAIAVGGAIGAAGVVGRGAAVAAKNGITAGGLAWKIAGGAAILGVLFTGIALSRRSPDAPAQAAAVPSAIAPPVIAASASPPEIATADPLPAAEPVKQEPPRAAPAPLVASADHRGARPLPSASAVAASPAVPAEDPLEAENRRLREAHVALQSGDADKALALLDEREAGNAGGQLREERAAARVLALCKAGRGAEARAAAEEFLRTTPRSPHADRVRGACPEKPTP